MRQSVVLIVVLVVLIGGLTAFLIQDNGVPPEVTPVDVGPAVSVGAGAEHVNAPDAAKGPAQVAEAQRSAMVDGKMESTSATEQTVLVTGRVLNSYGNTLAGAAVTLGRRGKSLLDSPEILQSRSASRWTAESDSDGRFEIQTTLPARKLRLGIRNPGYGPLFRVPIASGSQAVVELGDLVLEAGVSLGGRVVFEGGEGVAGAGLFANGTDGSLETGMRKRDLPEVLVATTDTSGAFLIEDMSVGAWELRVDSSQTPSRSFKGRTDLPGENQLGLSFLMPRGLPITGRIVGLPADQVGQLEVRASTSRGGLFSAMDAQWRDGEVQADGSFRIEGCEPGVGFVVFAFEAGTGQDGDFSNKMQALTEAVEAVGGDSDLQVPWIGKTSVRFRVVDSAGKALEKFKLKSGHSFLRRVRENGLEKEHFDGGHVLIADAGKRRGSGRGGDFRVSLEALGFLDHMESVDLEEGTTVDLGDVALTACGVLNLRIVSGLDGSPIPHAYVRLIAPRDKAQVSSLESAFIGANQSHETYSDDQGFARLSLFPGAVGQLLITCKGYGDMRRDNFPMLNSGDMDGEVALHGGGRVTVRASTSTGEKLVGIAIESRSDGLDESSKQAKIVVTNSHGVAVFEHVVAGPRVYRITGHQGSTNEIEFGPKGRGGAWVGLQVVDGEDHELSLSDVPRATLHGSLTQSGVALWDAELFLLKGAPGDPKTFASARLGPYQMVSDETGQFSVGGLAAGPYSLLVFHGSRAMGFTKNLTVVPGENYVSLDLPKATVSGRVTDGEGLPLAGVRISVEAWTTDGKRMLLHLERQGDTLDIGGDGTNGWVTNDEGFYSLRGITPNQAVRITASLPGMTLMETSFFQVQADSEKRDVDFVLDRAGSALVQLEGFESFFFVDVRAKYRGQQEDVSDVFEFVGQGNVLLEGLCPGPWEVFLRVFDGKSTTKVGSQKLEIEADKVHELVFRE